MTERFDETFHRLQQWTAGQAQSERLAAQLLIADGYTGVDPSHPLGGPDGLKDAIAEKHGNRWIMAAYFPRGQQPFVEVRKKFSSDLKGVKKNDANGIAFVTNQELTLGERSKLAKIAKDSLVEIFHIERAVALLDQPSMRGVRDQFLGIYDLQSLLDAGISQAVSKLEAIQTGGNSFCYWMLYYFDIENSIAKDSVFIRKGEHVLYDVRVRIRDMNADRDLINEVLGEINSPAVASQVKWSLQEEEYYRVFFSARNGGWHQDLQLKRIDDLGYWAAATQVKGRNGRDVVHLEVDKNIGEPSWRD